MKEEKLIHKINGKEYLKVNIGVITGSRGKAASERKEASMKKMGAIYLGIGEVKHSYFFGGYAKVDYLIPVDKLKEWEEIE